MDLGRDTASGLAAEIDALGEADWLDDELMRIKDSMASASEPTGEKQDDNAS